MWAMSFVFGLRLTDSEAGFIDATPVRTGKTSDFLLTRQGQEHALVLADNFWQANKAQPRRAMWWGAAVHSLMLGQGPRLLQFEQFIYLYMSLDACFALAKDMTGPTPKRLLHSERVSWMCEKFNMPVPEWAKGTSQSLSLIANLRNEAIHESLFMNAPLGFALHGAGGGINLMLEMKCLISRLLVALLGDEECAYIRTPTDTRQIYRWDPRQSG